MARELLTLKPGRYTFSFVVDGGKTDSASRLSWGLTCATKPGTKLMNAVVSASDRPKRTVAEVTVPSNCPAQVLALSGEAGEFPVPVNVTMRDVALRPLVGALP